jgi:transcriptional regulator with XRE-family HTH domain
MFLYPYQDGRMLGEVGCMTKKPRWEPTAFGASLKRLREERGYTLVQLASLADCHWNTLAKLERGEQEPAWPFVLILADVLGVECSAFTPEPAERPAAKPGRPRKAEGPSPAKAEDKPKKRTRKKDG